MTSDPILARVCVNLGYPCDPPVVVLTDIRDTIAAARLRLAREMGIVVNEEDPGDADLLVAFSLYRYRHRDSDREMPRSLRLDLNDRKVATAAGGGA